MKNWEEDDCREAGFLLNNSHSIEVGALVVTSPDIMKLTKLAMNIDIEVGALVVTSPDIMKLTQLALNIDIEVGALVVTSPDIMKLTQLALNIDIEVGALVVTRHDTVKFEKRPMDIDIEIDASHDTLRNTKHGMNIHVKVGALTDTSYGSVKVAKNDGKDIKDIVQVAKDISNFIFKKSVKDRGYSLLHLLKICLKPRARYRKRIIYKRCEHTGKVESDTSCLLFKMILLLLGGDIETNPGPRQRKASYDKRKRKSV